MRTVVSDGLLSCLIVGCLIFTGCDRATKTSPEQTVDETAQVDEAPLEVRDTMEGRWVFRMVRQTVAIPFSLVDVKKDGDTWTVEVPDVPSAPDAPQFTSGTASADTLELEYQLSANMGNLTFAGRLTDGTVRGTVEFSGGNIALGYLEATRLESVPQTPGMLPFNREHEKVIRDKHPVDGLLTFAASHPDSALAIDSFQRSLAFSKSEKLTAEKIESLIVDFKSSAAIWGERRVAQVPIDVAAMLGGLEYQPELAKKYYTEYRNSLTPEQLSSEKLVTTLGVLEARIEFAQNLSDLNSDDASKQTSAITKLEKVLDDNPLNARAVLALGRYYRDKANLNKAIEYYARLIAVPSLEKMIVDEIMARDPSASLPSQQLTELWKEKHGKLSGLDDYLNDSYRKTFASFAKNNKAAARDNDGDNKVALLELFTSGSSAECQGTDAAIDVIGQLYEPTELIVVRYHQHLSGPDPLASQELSSRFRYYNARTMPAMFINGMERSISGPIGAVAQLVDGVKTMVDDSISETVNVDFDVKAILDGEELKISATVKNIDDSDGGEYYLRMALAESEILHHSANGIRVHNMVTRSMPGGIRGIVVKDGTAVFEGRVMLGEVKKQLNNELAMIEQMANAPMPNRPLDFVNLKLVAMIQDDVDRRIIQSHMVEVTTAGTEPTTSGSKPDGASDEGEGEEEEEEEEAPTKEPVATPDSDTSVPDSKNDKQKNQDPGTKESETNGES